jgi:hypothetical protein
VNSALLLLRLRDRSPDGPAASLASLAIDDLLDRALADLIDPALLAAVLHERAPAFLGSPGGARAVESALASLLQWLDQHPGALGGHLSEEAQRALRSSARRPFAPDRDLLTHLLNRPAVRALIRDSVVDVLVSFGRRLAAPVGDSKVAKGFGDLGRFAARGAGALGMLAGNVMGAISEEIGRQAERMAEQSSDAAVTRLIQKLVEGLCDPARAGDQAALREALVDGAFELTGAQLAAQLRRNSLGPAAGDLREAVAAFLKSERGRALMDEGVKDLLARRGSQKLRELLAELELLEPFRATALEAVRAWFAPLIGSEAFAAWVLAVAAEAPAA